MKVKIVKCSKPGYWYADKIGCELHVVKRYYLIPDDEEKDSYQVIDSIKCIDKSDCEIVEQ